MVAASEEVHGGASEGYEHEGDREHPAGELAIFALAGLVQVESAREDDAECKEEEEQEDADAVVVAEDVGVGCRRGCGHEPG